MCREGGRTRALDGSGNCRPTRPPCRESLGPTVKGLRSRTRGEGNLENPEISDFGGLDRCATHTLGPTGSMGRVRGSGTYPECPPCRHTYLRTRVYSHTYSGPPFFAYLLIQVLTKTFTYLLTYSYVRLLIHLLHNSVT